MSESMLGYAVTSERTGPVFSGQRLQELRNALNRAVRWGLIQSNPMNMVDLPTVRAKETQIWTPEEARAFLSVCEKHEWGPLFTIILTLALRKGEALALQWADVSLERCSVSIRATLERREGVLVRKPPKTEKSNRTLHLPTPALRHNQKRQGGKSRRFW